MINPRVHAYHKEISLIKMPQLLTSLSIDYHPQSVMVLQASFFSFSI